MGLCGVESVTNSFSLLWFPVRLRMLVHHLEKVRFGMPQHASAIRIESPGAVGLPTVDLAFSMAKGSIRLSWAGLSHLHWAARRMRCS